MNNIHQSKHWNKSKRWLSWLLNNKQAGRRTRDANKWPCKVMWTCSQLNHQGKAAIALYQKSQKSHSLSRTYTNAPTNQKWIWPSADSQIFIPLASSKWKWSALFSGQLSVSCKCACSSLAALWVTFSSSRWKGDLVVLLLWNSSNTQQRTLDELFLWQRKNK